MRHKNTRSQVARRTLQEITDLGDGTLPLSLYSPDLSPTDYHKYKLLDNFLNQETFHCKEDTETALNDVLASRPLEFYRKVRNNLVDR